MTEPSKLDILQALLDAQRMLGEIFDVLEAGDGLDQAQLVRFAGLIRALGTAHQALVWDYAMSGRAADELLAHVRAGLAAPDEKR